MIVNPTVAKEIAIEFINLSNQRITPAFIARVIKQVKGLMELGFTEEEIRYTVTHITSTRPDIYSFGYIEACINDVLRQRKQEEMRKLSAQVSKDAQEQLIAQVNINNESEVSQSDEASERNRRKAERFGQLQSRKREKHYFDLFEGQ